MKKSGFVAALALTAALAVSAHAAEGVATLGAVEGKVLVNDGKGFAPALAGSLLAPGAKVMVGADSFASVNYGACAVSLEKPVVYTVKKDAACEAVISPVADMPDVAPALVGLPLLFVGAAVVGGGVLIATTLSDNDDPVSFAGGPVPK